MSPIYRIFHRKIVNLVTQRVNVNKTKAGIISAGRDKSLYKYDYYYPSWIVEPADRPGK